MNVKIATLIGKYFLEMEKHQEKLNESAAHIYAMCATTHPLSDENRITYEALKRTRDKNLVAFDTLQRVRNDLCELIEGD